MRITGLFFLVLFAQTSASFFSELTNSVSIVQSSIGKLISDTAVDLKDTFDCTVFAVRRAFSTSDISKMPGYEKCLGNTDKTIPVSSSKPLEIYIMASAAPAPPMDVSITRLTTKREQKSLEKKPDASNNAEDKSGGKRNVDNYLLNETLILMNMSVKLEHEFADLSKHVKDDLSKIEKEQKQKPIEKALKKIDKLLEIEVNSKNNTDSVHEDFNKILIKLDKNNTDKNNLKQDIKSAFEELELNKTQTNVERELKTWKKEELKNLDEIKTMLIHEQNDTLKANKMKNENEQPQKISSTTKATTTTVVTTTTTVPPTKTVSSTTPRTVANTVVPTTTQPAKKAAMKPPNDYDYLVSKDKSTLDSVRKLVGRSKQTEAIMAAILKRKKVLSSVFDRSELFRRK